MANLPTTMGSTAAVALGISPGNFIAKILLGDTVGGAIGSMLGLKKKRSPMDEQPSDSDGYTIPSSPY